MPSTMRHTGLSRAEAPGVPLSVPAAELSWFSIRTSSAAGDCAASAMLSDVVGTGCRQQAGAAVKTLELTSRRWCCRKIIFSSTD